MPAKHPDLTTATTSTLQALGAQLRQQRKQLGVSATLAAESAGMSRVTWHRIEQGNPSVTMGAYMSAAGVLGLKLQVAPAVAGAVAVDAGDVLPVHISLADYPQLQQLAWHVRGGDTFVLSPREALDIYERNGRHLDAAAMSEQEQRLLANLRAVLGGSASDI